MPCNIIEQKIGHVTRALNVGKKEAKGDLIIFTDDDAVAFKKWIKNYVKLHRQYKDVAGICSRDLYLDMEKMKIYPTREDTLRLRLSKWFMRIWLYTPLDIFKKYRFGIYISKDYRVLSGPYIPYKTCFSLPYKGVNLSFKSSHLCDIWLPEHSILKRAPRWEQYIGLKLVIKGFDTIYVPHNPVLHIIHRSLSRFLTTEDYIEFKRESEFMRSLFKSILNSS